jgi:hypothetical protein
MVPSALRTGDNQRREGIKEGSSFVGFAHHHLSASADDTTLDCCARVKMATEKKL